MARKKVPVKKAGHKALKHKVSYKKTGGRAHKAEKKPKPSEIKMPALLPPIEKDVVVEGAPKPKDEFFDEDEMKEFSILDEEEDGLEEDTGDVGDNEPAWDEEEY